MKKLSLFFIAVLLIIVSSCGKQKASVSHELHKIDILDSISYRLKTWGIYEDTSGIYLYAKDLQSNSVHFFKETEKGFESYRVFELPQLYIDTLQNQMQADIFEIALINLDSMIIFTRRSLALLDLKNNCLDKFFVHSLPDDAIDLVNRAGYLKWNPYRKTLPVMIVNSANREDRTWSYDTELLAEFSFETGELEILPIKYPHVKEYLSNTIKYLYQDPLIAFDEEKYVVAFQNCPVVFTYNPQTEALDSFFIENPNYKPFAEKYDTIDLEKIDDFATLQTFLYKASACSFSYSSLIYDEHKNVFYRFFYKDMPEKQEEDIKHILDGKKLGLTVLDKNMNMLGDTYWDGKENVSQAWFPTSKGIYGLAYGNVDWFCYAGNKKPSVIKITLNHK